MILRRPFVISLLALTAALSGCGGGGGGSSSTSATTYPSSGAYQLTTAGADGLCDSSDDGRAEVRKDASLGLVLTPISTGSAPLGLVRDPATLAPAGWLFARTVGLWNGSSYSYVTIRSSTDAPLQSVVGSTYRQTLAWDGTQLSVIDFSNLRAPFETPLNPAITGSTEGWQLIGFDATAFYVYTASTTSFTDPWRMLKVWLAAPTATQMASGTGVVALSSMGNSWLYLTVADQLCSGTSTCTYLIRVKKADVGLSIANADFIGAPNTLIRMEAGANGIDLLSFEPVVESGPSVTTLAYFKEFDAEPTQLPSPLGDIPSAKSMGLAAASTLNFNSSESRTRFVYATGYTVAQQFNSATLNALETSGSSYSPIALGALPGATDYGSDPSLASVIAGPSAYGSAYVARVSGGSLQSSGSKVYSFDAGTANSLTLKTKVVN